MKALAGAHRDPSKLAGLTPAGTRTPPGCEVYWRRRGAAFVGAMKPGTCRVESQRSGKTIVVSDDLYLDDDEIWIHDRAVDEQGGHVYGNRAGIPNKLRKVSWFGCWLSVRRDGVAEGDLNAWSFDRDIAVHDEAVSEPAKAVSYGWADPGAQRLGINLRWMQASCSQRR